jgi:hypothetical protein
MPRSRRSTHPPTYEGEVLSVLAFDFSLSDHSESERKIKRRLRDKKLGAYDQARIDRIRTFKDDLKCELGKYAKSVFYVRSNGKYADFDNWVFERLRRHLVERHSSLPEAAITQFLPYAIYIYYLR